MHLDDHDEPLEHVSDPLDRATQLETLEREAVIALAATRFRHDSERRARDLAAGVCLNCDATLTPGIVYCDAGCRDDHQRRTQAAARSGNTPPETFDAHAKP